MTDDATGDESKLRAHVPGVSAGRAERPASAAEERARDREAEAQALKQAAFAELQVGYVEDAMASLARAAELEPDEPGSHSDQGVIAKVAGRFDEAERHYRKALEVSPGDATTLFNLGNLYWRQGRKQEAGEAYRQALRSRPRFAETLNALGVVRIDAGEVLAAAKLFEEALEARPDYLPALGNLGHARMLQGQPGPALQCYDRALAKAPRDAKLRLKKIRALMLLERPDEALAACREALDAGLADGEICILAATLLERKGQAALADEAFAQAEKAGLDTAAAHCQMGQFLLRRGRDIERAAGHLFRAVSLEPDHFEALLGLAQACVRLDRRQDAERLLQRLLTLESGQGLSRQRLDTAKDEARALLARLKAA